MARSLNDTSNTMSADSAATSPSHDRVRPDLGAIARTHSSLRNAGESFLWASVSSDGDREHLDTSRGYEDLEVFRELLRRHPPRCDFVKHIDLFMGPADGPESATSYWLDSWERSYARWSRLFESIPSLPACTILDLNALHVHLLYRWLPKLPNLTHLRYWEEDVDGAPAILTKAMPPPFPSRLQKLDFSVDGDIHCDLLDNCLSASASSLRCLELDVNDNDEDLCRKVKDILLRHEQSLHSLVAMTLTRECYTGDDTFPALRELGYVHGSKYEEMVHTVQQLSKR